MCDKFGNATFGSEYPDDGNVNRCFRRFKIQFRRTENMVT